jgi:hypothetical protein
MIASILTYVRKILGDFSGSRESVRIIYININGNFIFDLWIFTLRTVSIERTAFVNRGMGTLQHERFRIAGVTEKSQNGFLPNTGKARYVESTTTS